MLQKSKSKQVKLLKYALLIPMVFGMLVYTSCAKEEIQNSRNELSISDQIETLKATMNAKDGQLTDEEKQSLLKLLENVNHAIIFSDSYREVIVGKHIGGEDITVSESFVGQVEVPYAVIEQAPVFTGCENLASNEEKKKCTSDKITEFVGKNFNTKIAKENGLTGRQRITVLFKIDREGNIVDVQSRAPHSSLEAEANRVVALLPKMVPGKQRGKNVTVPYSLPIVFEAQ